MTAFHVCIHDASPLYAREIGVLIRRLAPLVGRRLSFGVVPDWHGAWPLGADPAFSRLLRDSADELLLHGCCHQRRRGRGPVAAIAGNCDEMNGLTRDETRSTIARGQQIFADVFGAPARGFLPPAWQRGHVRGHGIGAFGLDHVLGYFTLESRSGHAVPLVTWTWDCGRWRWLGHIGHGVGRLRQSLVVGVPVLAIHPRDLAHGYLPSIVALTEHFLAQGYEPAGLGALFETNGDHGAA